MRSLFSSRVLIGLFAVLSVLICANNLWASEPTPEGQWSSQCYALPKRHSIIFQSKFSENTLYAKAFQFADSACKTFNLTMSLKADYFLGRKSGDGFEINLEPKSLTIQIFNPGALTYFNKTKACGLSNWTINTEKSVIGLTCAPSIVSNLKNNGTDIYNVVDGSLLFGEFPFSMAQVRPTELNHVLPLKRMVGDVAEVVSFQSGSLILHGLLYMPIGNGPFPAVLYNHGSAPGMLNSQAAEILGPLYAKSGWIFFMPYRRGQGLSASAGHYIGDQIDSAEKSGGMKAAQATMVHLLASDHLQDQLAALDWLKKQSYVSPGQIGVAGNSFGGVETILGAEKGSYCAAIDASGGAESWAEAPDLRSTMLEAASHSNAPIFLFQAENDFDLSPTHEITAAMKKEGKIADFKIYPAFGRSPKEGHSFAYLGSNVWFPDAFQFLKKYCVKDRK